MTCRPASGNHHLRPQLRGILGHDTRFVVRPILHIGNDGVPGISGTHM